MSAKKGTADFLVFLPQKIIVIPQDSNLSWLTLFYALPRELVEKRPVYLELPRKPYSILRTHDYDKLLMDDAFLELVWDCYAWTAWQFFKVPDQQGGHHELEEDWSHYSGDFPLWRMSYDIIRYFRHTFEYEMEWSFQRLFLMGKDDELPWLSYKQFGNLVGNLTDRIVDEQDWQPVIDEIWQNKQPDDYSGGQNSGKRDFMRSWNHDRKYKSVSLEGLGESGVRLDGDLLYDIPDPRAEFETAVLSRAKVEQFKDGLSDTDRQIMQLRMDGFSQQEIADKLDFKTASVVSKHLAKLAAQYEDLVSGEYDDYLKKH